MATCSGPRGIAHGVRLLQRVLGICGSSALRAMAGAGGLLASRTGCGSYKGVLGICGSSALRAMAGAGGLLASRTGCGSYKGVFGICGSSALRAMAALEVCSHRAWGAVPTAWLGLCDNGPVAASSCRNISTSAGA
jgi:hypothetical protein